VINIIYGDRIEITVNFSEINAAITLGLDLVAKEVTWGGQPIRESVFNEVLIMLHLKDRRFYGKGSRIKPSGLKGLCVTDEFCSNLERVMSTLVKESLLNGTLKAEV
jgi:hypothetical protein